MSKNEERIILSNDGSHTLFSEKFNVTYHSKFGALEESLTVFLSAGYHFQRLRGIRKINIFEMGFGSGLNALLTMIEADKYQCKTHYTGIECYPISVEEAKKLNYIEELSAKPYSDSFLQMHQIESNHTLPLSSQFSFQKIIGDLTNYSIPGEYDVVYFDAFAPTAQEELWTEEIMKKMFDILRPEGVLVTYCAKGSFKRALKAVGFNIEALPGPGGKREMTRAIKNPL